MSNEPCILTLRSSIYALVPTLTWRSVLSVSRQYIDAYLHAADLDFLQYSTVGLLLLPWMLRRTLRHLVELQWCKGMTRLLLAGPLLFLADLSGLLFASLGQGAAIQLGAPTRLNIMPTALLVELSPRRWRPARPVFIASRLWTRSRHA